MNPSSLETISKSYSDRSMAPSIAIFANGGQLQMRAVSILTTLAFGLSTQISAANRVCACHGARHFCHFENGPGPRIASRTVCSCLAHELPPVFGSGTRCGWIRRACRTSAT
jgi:hypothetical protein